MSKRYVAIFPTPMGDAFVMERGFSSEYPNAKKFTTLKDAKSAAIVHADAQVYTTEGYENGNGPVWRAA
jgi:hypothetical protein